MNRYLDILFLLFLSPVLIPVLLVITLFALLFHKRNILFYQLRIGKDHKIFRLIKFRSMVLNAENLGTGLYSYCDDNRITRFGKFLRMTSLDELPQVINILKGDMSFIGPRPAVVGELDQEQGLPKNIYLRFKIKPGLTGWAQINGRDNLNWKEKSKYDIEFIKAKGLKKLLMITKILIYTPFYLLKFSATYEKRK